MGAFSDLFSSLKKKTQQGFSAADDFIVSGSGRASTVAKQTLTGFNSAGLNLTADVAGLVGLNGVAASARRDATAGQKYLDRSKAPKLLQLASSSLFAPGRFAYEGAFKPGFNTVMGAANATAGLKVGNRGYAGQQALSSGLSALQTATVPVTGTIKGITAPLIYANPIRNTVGNVLEARRTGRPMTDASQILGGESSLSRGLGVDDPLAALAIDTISDPTMIPGLARGAVKGGQLAMKGAPAVKAAGAAIKDSYQVNPTKLIDGAAAQLDATGSRAAIRDEFTRRWSRNLTGSRDDMRAAARHLGMPESVQKLTASELKEVFSRTLGLNDTPLPRTVQRRLNMLQGSGGFARIPGKADNQLTFAKENDFPSNVAGDLPVGTIGRPTPVFRGTTTKGEPLNIAKANGITGGESTSINRAVAERFAATKGGDTQQYTLRPDARVINHSDLEAATQGLTGRARTEAAQKLIRDNRIDVVRFDVPGGAQGEEELRIVSDRAVSSIRPQNSAPGAAGGRDILDQLPPAERSRVRAWMNGGRAKAPLPANAPATQKEAAKDLPSWEVDIRKLIAGLKGENRSKYQAFNALNREDPLMRTGIRGKSKSGVTTAEANFPSKTLSFGLTRDKAAFSYQRETLLRNLEETFGRKSQEGAEMKAYLYTPIVEHETANTSFKNGIRRDMRSLFAKASIKKGGREDYAAADYIEGNLTDEDLGHLFGDRATDIKATAEAGRAVYKDLLTKTNAELEKYGYPAIPERSNYVTHTQQIGIATNLFGSLLNIPAEKLPTAISSINTTTKPGRRFFQFAQMRKGGSTHEGLITALDKYLDPAGNQIYHTGDIQRARQVQTYLQQQASAANNGDTRLSNFADYMGQYADMLAGKQNIIDRPFEKVFGRGILKVGDGLRRRTGANMIGGSLSTALTAYIPLTQSLATTAKPAAARAMLEATAAPFRKGNVIDGVESAFMTRRFPETKITGTKTEKVQDAAFALMNGIDRFTTQTVVGGKYYEGLARGLGKGDAMAAADEYAARLMSDRSAGQTPLILNSKVLGAFTQFQNEVNNQVSVLTKDIPNNFGYDRKGAALALGQVVLLSYAFNQLFEATTGRRPAFDPLNAALSLASNLSDGESILSQFDVTDSDSPAGQIAANIPFAGALTGGRVPLSGAIPNPIALANGDSSLGKELAKPLAYLVPPAAGGQIKRSLEGVNAYLQGASKTDAGKERFPIAANPANAAKTALFGQYAANEAPAYFQGTGAPSSSSGSTSSGSTTGRPKSSEALKQNLSDLKKQLKETETGSQGFLGIGRMSDSERESKRTEIEGRIAEGETAIKLDTVSQKIAKLPRTTGDALQSGRVKQLRKGYAKDLVQGVIDGEYTATQVGPLLKKLGVTDPQNIEFEIAKSLPIEDRSAYAWETVSGGGNLTDLIAKKLITSAVADQWEDEGRLSSDQVRSLKSLIKGKTGTASRASNAKPVKFSLGGPSSILKDFSTSGSGGLASRVKLDAPTLRKLTVPS